MSDKDMSKRTKSDLARLDAVTDDAIDTSDIPALRDDFFARAKWRLPRNMVTVEVEIEQDILDWFKSQGAGYERYLAAALRIYAEAHSTPAP